ncbi:MAG TPA: SMC-Scp complex subunit ScpB [Candidatus Angelobacter sp.]|nr:SMC-Scp complex subunit ScpB [Candidatus Angelobacter sp.]
MAIKPKLEALIYAAEEPISVDQLAALLRDDLLALKNTGVSQSDTEAELSRPAEEQAEAHLGAVESQTPPSGSKRSSQEKSEKAELRALLKPILDELTAEYASESHGIEIRQVAGGYRMSTKPEHHDVVRAFAKSLKPPIRLSLQALETLAVIAYKQPVTVPEISEIRGVDASGVIGTLIDRKLITTAGRKAVVGRPMLYRTTKDFLMRFGLKDLHELPSVEEFEKLVSDDGQEELFAGRNAPVADATGVPEVPEDAGIEQMAEDKAEVPQNVTEPTVSSDPLHDKTDEEAAGQIASESEGG